jgi:hypothetical protein
MLVFDILAHTPLWVWALFAFLVYRGVAAMREREVSPYRVLIVPALFFVWGVSSLLERSDGSALNVAAFVAALLVGAAAGRALGSLMPAPSLSPVTGMLAMPGSPVALILNCVAFAAKYVGSVALALTSVGVAREELASVVVATGGLFAGLFWGRTLRQFQRALQADGRPATLGALVALVLARGALREA